MTRTHLIAISLLDWLQCALIRHEKRVQYRESAPWGVS